MIDSIELSKNYGPTRALNNATFKIEANEVVGLLGPNGAGKTTLMKILTGFIHPTTGNARIKDLDVVENTLAVQAKIGYLPENAPVYQDMVVQEYLEMIADIRQISLERRVAMISEAVIRTGLEDYLVKPISQLSKGYRQRVGLAQAILHKPEVLILDEPTSGLDPSQIVEIRQLIKDLAKSATVLLSTHILSEVELTCERVLIINKGEVKADARLDKLQASNKAIAVVDGEPEAVRTAFSTAPGVSEVEQTAHQNGFATYRITGESADLCLSLFDVVKAQGWRLAELRPDTQTLETVFRNVVDQGRTIS